MCASLGQKGNDFKCRQQYLRVKSKRHKSLYNLRLSLGFGFCLMHCIKIAQMYSSRLKSALKLEYRLLLAKGNLWIGVSVA